MSLDRVLAVVGCTLYVTSLFLPAIEGSGFPALDGWAVLRQGAGAWRDGVVAWYANPLFVASLLAIVFARFRLGLAIGLAALVLSLSSFSASTTAEAFGRSVPAFSYAIGFYCWLSAFVAMILAAGAGIYKESRAGRVA